MLGERGVHRGVIIGDSPHCGSRRDRTGQDAPLRGSKASDGDEAWHHPSALRGIHSREEGVRGHTAMGHRWHVQGDKIRLPQGSRCGRGDKQWCKHQKRPDGGSEQPSCMGRVRVHVRPLQRGRRRVSFLRSSGCDLRFTRPLLRGRMGKHTCGP